MNGAQKNTFHPNFLIGAASFLLFLAGVVIRSNGYGGGDYIILSAICLGALHYIWSVIDVFRNDHLNANSRMLWIIIVLLVPPIGGMCYYLMSRKNVQL